MMWPGGWSPAWLRFFFFYVTAGVGRGSRAAVTMGNQEAEGAPATYPFKELRMY